jgi:hypothetical protein
MTIVRGTRLLLGQRWKLSDRFTAETTSLVKMSKSNVTQSEDEQFFVEADLSAEEELMANLKRERLARDAKEQAVLQTPEWQQYDAEVTAVTQALEREWMTSPQPITKDVREFVLGCSLLRTHISNTHIYYCITFTDSKGSARVMGA